MKVVLDSGEVLDLGETEATPTIGIVDYSRRVTDDYGLTTVVERGFARRMSVNLVVPFDETDALQRNLAAIRAKPARWIADEGVDWLDFRGFYKDFEVNLPVPPKAYCTLTVEALTATEAFADPGGDPAPLGSASTLQLLQPVTIAGGALVASTVPENDYLEWSAFTTYPLGARVIKASTHRIYESAALDNRGNDPTGTSGKWRDIGPTNRWAMFDQALGSTTEAAGGVTVVLAPGTVNSVALLDVKAATVRVEAAGYDRTSVPNASGTVTFLDMPETDGQLTVTITGPGTVEVGTLLVGKLVGLGSTTDEAKAGITDFSRKEADEFGDIQIVERAWAKRMTLPAKLRRDAIDLVAGRIAAVRAKPSLWIGKEGMETLTVYGFFKDFSIAVDTTICTLSLSIEGLSTAGKVEPLTASVDWPDIGDPNGTKPEDNATRNVSRGEWAEGVQYLVGDIVTYQGSSYVVIVAHTALVPPPSANFTLLASAGNPGAPGGDGEPGPPGPDAVSAALTSSARSVWAYANGVVKEYSGITTTVVIRQGTVDVSANFNVVIASNPNALQVTLSGRTATVVGAGTATGEFGNTAVLAATLTLRATGTGAFAGTNFDLVFALGKITGGYEIVTTLPTTANFVGRLVVLSANGKLYRYTANGWTSAVEAGDITGGINATQFADGIEPVTIITVGALPTVKTTSAIVYGGKLYRWNGTAYVTTVDANDLAADSVTSAKIAAGAVNTRELAAGVVTTDKLVVQTSGNLLFGATPGAPPSMCWRVGWQPGGVILDEASGWPITSPAVAGNFPDPATWSTPDYGTYAVHQINETAPGVFACTDVYFRTIRDLVGVGNDFVTVTPNDYYEFSCYVGSHRCSTDMYIQWFDANYQYVSISNNGADSQSPDDFSFPGGNWIGRYKRNFVRGWAPSTATFAQIILRKNTTTPGGLDSWMFFVYPQFAKCVPNATQLMDYVQPASTILSGQGLLTQSVTTDALRAGSVTAAKMAVTELSAITSRIGLLRTADTGQRMELDSNNLRSFYPNNAMAGRMGIW